MMDIIIGKNTPIQNETTNAAVPVTPVRRVTRKEKRKNMQDRRQSVRDGIIVSLSFKKERRKQRGRRKSDYHTWA
jgi:hypothetical protein